MDTSPEPESPPSSDPITVSQVEETHPESYFRSYDEAPGLEALSTAATGNFYMRPVCTPSYDALYWYPIRSFTYPY